MADYLVNLWGEHAELIIDLGYKGLLAAAVLLAGFAAARLVRQAIVQAPQRLKKFDDVLVPIFSTTATYSIYAISLVIILDIFGVNTTSIIALLGAAGLAVGLALKDTLGNIAAGIMLLILRPYRIGDYIECGSQAGTVREIGLFTTILETFDGLYVFAPNGAMWGTPVKNFTRNGRRRMDVVVGIAYDDSIDAGFEALRGVIRSEPRMLPDPAPQVMVQELADSSVNLGLRCWTTVDDFWDTWWDLKKRVKEEIEAAGLTIPFPQQDVHLNREGGQRNP
ncbi:MAG: mechanosensitive ion channel family protein [Deltaproteobacteria bacterium]|nr:mechanosensitive ion channel family protein [Candidatus Anaeroferrophillus wilburensis]MBN2888014.1 mechanosensitive ion channel family protein [Deltaproteobacteria bacterium]